ELTFSASPEKNRAISNDRNLPWSPSMKLVVSLASALMNVPTSLRRENRLADTHALVTGVFTLSYSWLVRVCALSCWPRTGAVLLPFSAPGARVVTSLQWYCRQPCVNPALMLFQLNSRPIRQS